MTVKDIIIFLSKQEGFTQDGLAANLGYTAHGSISVPLSRNDGMGMRVEMLIKWLEALDAQLVVESIKTGDGFVLDGWSEGISYQ